MPYQEKAQIIFKYLRANFPKCSVGHRWDFKLETEWYFLQKEKLRIRILVLFVDNGVKLLTLLCCGIYFKTYIAGSIADMQSLLIDVDENVPKEEKAFLKVEDERVRPDCNFRKVCDR